MVCVALQEPLAGIFLKQRRGSLEGFARIEGGRDRSVVKVVEFAADRDTLGQGRHLNAVQFIRDIVGRGLAIDCGPQRENDFGDVFSRDAAAQFRDTQFIGANVIKC